MHVLRIPRDLSLERGSLSGSTVVTAGMAEDRAALRGVTLDFGNTLVPVTRAALVEVVTVTCRWLAARTGATPEELAWIWDEERERQWREDVPAFRETDMRIRMARVIARSRGTPPPPEDERWDDESTVASADPTELATALDVYGHAFAALPPSDGAGALLARLAGRGLTLGILSNWPLAAAIDYYAEVHGWTEHLTAIVVSERVGTIKPRVEIFRAAEAALGLPPASLLHVGDDWTADVEGALDAGWHAAWVRDRPADTPLPGGAPDPTRRPDLVLDRLADLDRALDSWLPPPAS